MFNQVLCTGLNFCPYHCLGGIDWRGGPAMAYIKESSGTEWTIQMMKQETGAGDSARKGAGATCITDHDVTTFSTATTMHGMRNGCAAQNSDCGAGASLC